MSLASAYEEQQRAEIKALLETEGADHVQKLLQAEIAKLKKKESELAVIKKRNSVQQRENEQLQEKLRKMERQLKIAEEDCEQVKTATKRLAVLVDRSEADMRTRREDIREKVQNNCQEMRAKYEERQAEIDALEAANADLQRQVDEQKATFEQSLASLETDLNQRTSAFQEIVSMCEATSNELSALHTQLVELNQEQKRLYSSKTVMLEQIKIYEAQFESFANNTMSADDVKEISAKQKEQLEKRLEMRQNEKNEVIEMRTKLDREIADFRTQTAALKRDHTRLEKQRLQLEKKCRQLKQKQEQQQLKKKNNN